MRIEFETGETTVDELTAIIALCASLGGRLPSRGIGEVHVDIDARHAKPDTLAAEERAPPPPPAGNTADALMQAEEARVAVETAIATVAAYRALGVSADGAAVVLDADGIPWDARIHAGTKTQTKGKTWTKLRNVKEVLYGEVHAELQERYAAQFAAEQEAGNPGTGTGANGAELPAAGIAGDPPAPNPPSSSPDPAAPPPPSATGNDAAESAPTGQETAGNAGTAGRFADFPGFVQAVNAIRVPPIPYLELNTFAQTVGVAGGFKDMKDAPELWESFFGLAGGQ